MDMEEDAIILTTGAVVVDDEEDEEKEPDLAAIAEDVEDLDAIADEIVDALDDEDDLSAKDGEDLTGFHIIDENEESGAFGRDEDAF